MRRRIKLAEEQKRSTSTKAKQKADSDKEAKENFEQWLDRKRREQQRSQRSSDEETSEDDDDAENSQAFNDWLKDLKERPLRRPHTSTPASLHRRKSRPLKDLIQVSSTQAREHFLRPRSSRMRSDTLCVVTNISLHGVNVKGST